MHRHREAMGSVRWMETERRKRLTWRILFIWQLFITFSRYWNSFFRISKHYYAYMSYFGILILSLSHIRTFFEVCDAPSPHPSLSVSTHLPLHAIVCMQIAHICHLHGECETYLVLPILHISIVNGRGVQAQKNDLIHQMWALFTSFKW